MSDLTVSDPSRPRVRIATSSAVMVPANPATLRRVVVGQHVPRAEQYRTHYGRSLDLGRIDYAIRNAGNGFMMPLTDISRETLSLCGHSSSLLQKRLNRIGALDHQIVAAEGPGVDARRADFYAAFVRDQLDQISNFRDRLIDLAWAVFDGRAASEIDWRFRDGDWHANDLWWIHPRRLSFGPERDLRIVDTTREVGDFRPRGFPLEEVPYKFIKFKPRLFADYQEREGLAPRVLYWEYFIRFGTRERLGLLESFGKPWRIVMPEDNIAINEEQLDEAFEAVNVLGATNTARLPARVRVQVEQPREGAGKVHDEAIQAAEKTLSKLILGNTGTTDAVSTGLGSSIGDAHLSEEDLIIATDARRLAEAIEDQLTDAIVAANFGPQEVRHAPRFLISTEAPLDAEAESKRIESALKLGLEVPLEEARKALKIREPRTGEVVLRVVRRTPELGQPAPEPSFEMVFPIGQAPAPGEIQDTPMSALNVPADAPQLPPVPSQEDSGALPGATPPGPPQPQDTPDVAGSDTASALAAKMTELGIARCEHGRSNRCPLCGIERERDVELDEGGSPIWAVRWRPIGP